MLDRIKHLFGIHKYVYVERLSIDSHFLRCKYCNKKFAMNTSVKCLIEWDQELADLYYRIKKDEPRQSD